MDMVKVKRSKLVWLNFIQFILVQKIYDIDHRIFSVRIVNKHQYIHISSHMQVTIDKIIKILMEISLKIR